MWPPRLPKPLNRQPKFRAFLWERVFSDKYIWIVSAANFFVYVLRYAIFDWGHHHAQGNQGHQHQNAAWIIAGFEFAGLGGMLLSGWLTDRLFRGWARRCASSICCWPASRSGCSGLRRRNNIWLSIGSFGSRRLLHLRSASACGRHRRKAGHQTGRCHRRWPDEHLRLRQHCAYGLGLGTVVQTLSWKWVFGELIAFAAIGAILFAAALPADVEDYSQAVPE